MNSTPQATSPDFDAAYPIRVLAQKTGVGSSTLRAWERRYGLLKPLRTPKGHRLYGEEDINRVKKILQWLDDGHSFKVIAARLASQVQLSPVESPDQQTSPAGSVWEEYVQACLDATRDFSIERIDAVYNEASSLYPLEMVTERLIQPVLFQLGEGWQNQPQTGVAEEHFYSSWLKGKLSARLQHAYANARGARIVCACMPGCYHEIGLMLFALSALSRGYRVLYFGANLPLNQIQYILEHSAARAVVLSTQGQHQPKVLNEFKQLMLDINRPLFIGGSSDQQHLQSLEGEGAILLGDRVSVAMHVLEGHVPAFTSV